MGAKALQLTRSDMDEALVSSQLHLLYQPIFSLRDGALVRVEALVRWDHPRFGTMLPAVFLPAFEAEDRLPALTQRILERGATEFSSWSLRSPSALSVNLSPKDCIDPDLPATVKSVLEATHLHPEKLHFECPVRTSDGTQASPILHALKDLGVGLVAELMGRPEDVADIFAIAPFDEVKTSGRGLLRAARNNHTASLTGAADVIAYAESQGAIVTAIGAEDEAACQALRTVGFHQIQANVLSPASLIDGITPKATLQARQILGFDQPGRSASDLAERTASTPKPSTFFIERKQSQAEAFKRAAEKKTTDAENELPPVVQGAKAFQSQLSRSYGEGITIAGTDQSPVGMDVREQQERATMADGNAGLLMRTDLAAASLGYGASPLRTLPKKKEDDSAPVIAEVISALPAALAEREWDDTTKADALDAEVAKLPTIDEHADDTDADMNDTTFNEDLLNLASRLRPDSGKKKNFLTRKYKLKVTHFWPRSWRGAWMRVKTAQEQARLDAELESEEISRPRSEEDTVPVMTDSREDTVIEPIDEGPSAADKGAEAIKTADDLTTDEAGKKL